MILFAAASFLLHPRQFIKDWRRSQREFDKDGYPK